jgi:hypothetical protein
LSNKYKPVGFNFVKNETPGQNPLGVAALFLGDSKFDALEQIHQITS